MNYAAFLGRKRHLADAQGFKPTWIPDSLYGFQAETVRWAVRQGRAAIFADCGLGKTPMQLAWAQNVVRHTNKPVLILTPLAVGSQTMREAEKFGVPAARLRTGGDPGRAIVAVTNYEQLQHCDPAAYAGVVCDESSILKNFDGATRQRVTEFCRTLRYRLLCTATAAPNDTIELGTSSEALGELGYADMLSQFFVNDESSIAPLSHATKWRFKPHAEPVFWRWLASWARAFRSPEDIGYPADGFRLPSLETPVQTVAASRPLDGHLFTMPARTLQEQRQERRATLEKRCEAVAALATSHDRPFVAWCHLNDEGKLLARLIPDAVEISGADSDERKEEVFEGFASGAVRVLVTKPRIGGFGMNWQHCSDLSLFPSHSYEQYYQAIRRCWRFGQQRPVTATVITTEGEGDVLGNLQRKAAAADAMFASIVQAMADARRRRRAPEPPTRLECPPWIRSSPTITRSTTATVAS